MLGVFFYQLYWLNGLYQTTSKQFDKDIYEAMDIADQYEIAVRSEMINDTVSEESASMNIGMHSDSTGNKVMYSYNQATKDTVNQSNASQDDKNSLSEHVKDTEKLAAYLKKTMHYINDQFIAVDINVFDSTLVEQLTKANINRPYQIFIIQCGNDSICAAGNNNSKFNTKYARQYDFYYDFNDEHSYRLFVKNPNKQLLSQMLGMLISSVLILAFLIFTFYYLLKTIRKMQTEEELKNNFTNNMTHELKTPIAVSYAAIDALLVSDSPADEKRQEKYLNIAKDQMEQLTGLVEQILSMSRKDNKKIDLKPEKIDLPQMIQNLIERAKLFSDKEVTFETDLKTPSLNADKMHLFNMLNNLIENGIKYSSEKVHIKISSYEKSEGTILKVTDNGPGIDAKYQSRIFDKFYRIPTGNRYNTKGYGIGLFYVKEMAERHGGEIVVESQTNKGATFMIKIPKQWIK